jgi:hypothetical protein
MYDDSSSFKRYLQSVKRDARRRGNKTRAAQTRKANALRKRRREHDPKDPRPELLFSAQRQEPIAVPTLTLSPSSYFVSPHVVIESSEDIDRLVRSCFNDQFRPGESCRYSCPRHPGQNPRTLIVLEHPGSSPLLHCYECGYRLTALEWIYAVCSEDTAATLDMAGRLWPEKIRPHQIDSAEMRRLVVQSIHRYILTAGRLLHVEDVVDGGVEPAFGDWISVTDQGLKVLLTRHEIPLAFEPDS